MDLGREELEPTAKRIAPARPTIEDVLVYLAYRGHTAQVDAVLNGACNRALWADAELHAVLGGVPRGPGKRTRMGAARAGDARRLTMMLHTPSRANVNGADSAGWTALHLAARVRGRRRAAAGVSARQAWA